jgi:ribosomal protein L29
MEKKPAKEIMANYQALNVDELKDLETKMKEDLALMHFKNKSSQLDDLGALRRTKKNYARLKTVLTQKQNAKSAE